MELREIRYQVVGGIYLALYTNKWRALVNKAMNMSVVQKARTVFAALINFF